MKDNNSSRISDEITQFLKTGDNQFWGKIYERYKQQIFKHCLGILKNIEDAKDITSQTFIKAYENINKYNLDKPFQPWLYRIATNNCIDFIRKQVAVQFQPLTDYQYIDEENTYNEDEKEKIKAAVKQLNILQRRCFCLFYFHEKSYKDIVKITGYSKEMVRSYIQNGRRNFKLIIGKLANE